MKEILKVDNGARGTSINVPNFPSNSIMNRNKPVETKTVEKVVTGKVYSAKKTPSSKFLKSFIKEDVGSVGDYLLHDVLIPAVKSLFSDIVQSGIERMLFGETRKKSSTNYNSVSSHRIPDRGRGLDKDSVRKRNQEVLIDDIVVETRPEANRVLSRLVELTREYGQATVADLYDLVGVTGNGWPDTKQGWTDLRNANIRPVRGGYLLNLPRTVDLS